MFSQEIFEAAHNKEIIAKYQNRWKANLGFAQHEVVLELIRKGGGEDFLFNALENGQLSWQYFENDNDLKGISLNNENVSFPLNDNFEGTDLSYSTINNCEFTSGYFNAKFESAYLYNVIFVNCTFHFATFKNCTLIKCHFKGCDFIERCEIINSNLQGTIFEDDYMVESIFKSCKFDNNVVFKNLRQNSRNNNYIMAESERANIYFNLAEGYQAGNSYLFSQHFFLANRFVTKYRTKSWLQKMLRAVFFEYLMGYGERPFRCICFSLVMIFLFGILYFLFGLKNSFEDIGFSACFVNSTGFSIVNLISNLGDSLFFSIVTFTTVGYGNIIPSTAIAKILSSIEMLIGVTLSGCWVALLLRKLLR